MHIMGGSGVVILEKLLVAVHVRDRTVGVDLGREREAGRERERERARERETTGCEKPGGRRELN